MSNGSDLVSRLLAHVGADGLFAAPGVALLAVSGGPDSLALLELMTGVAGDLGLELQVAHVDHGIAPESARVAHDVVRAAARLGLPCHVRAVQLGPDIGETAARRARYAALRAVQRAIGARYLVTGHHRDDQVETVLQRFLRGTGLAGLAGIPRRGPRGLVRPLLPFRRRELREWLLRHRQPDAYPIHDDPANRDVRHDRSWLRTEVVPVLTRRFGERCIERMGDVARHAADERRAWRALLTTLPELDFQLSGGVAEVARAPLARYDKALSEALLRAVARELGVVVGPQRSRRLVSFAIGAASGRRLSLGGGAHAEVAFDRLRLVVARRPTPSPAALSLEAVAPIVGGGWRFVCRRERAGVVVRASRTTWVAAEPMWLRAPLAGDRMRPLGGVGHRKVARLLMEARVPAGERGRYPLVACGERVLWVPGVCRGGSHVPAPGDVAVRIDADRV